MSVYFTDGECPPSFLASTSGWGAFTRWAESLPADEYGELLHLSAHGWADRMNALRRQLASALDESPDDDTAEVGDTLLGLLDGADAAAITDGLAPDGAEDEVDDHDDFFEQFDEEFERVHPRGEGGKWSAESVHALHAAHAKLQERHADPKATPRRKRAIREKMDLVKRSLDEARQDMGVSFPKASGAESAPKAPPEGQKPQENKSKTGGAETTKAADELAYQLGPYGNLPHPAAERVYAVLGTRIPGKAAAALKDAVKRGDAGTVAKALAAAKEAPEDRPQRREPKSDGERRALERLQRAEATAADHPHDQGHLDDLDVARRDYEAAAKESPKPTEPKPAETPQVHGPKLYGSPAMIRHATPMRDAKIQQLNAAHLKAHADLTAKGNTEAARQVRESFSRLLANRDSRFWMESKHVPALDLLRGAWREKYHGFSEGFWETF